MAVRLSPPILFALILGAGLLLCLPQMKRARGTDADRPAAVR